VSARGEALRIVVLGYLVRGPMGGMAWSQLHYPAGLHALGHDVHFFEDSGDSDWCCYDPSRGVNDTDPTYGLEFAAGAFAALGLGERWAYYDAHTRGWLGPEADRALAICHSADLLIDISGGSAPRSWLTDIPARALIDTDPAFNQIANLTDPEIREAFSGFTAYFSFAENIGRDGCTVPDDGVAWQITRQPIFLDGWPATPGRSRGKFTTVMQWDSYPAPEHAGVRYGMKSDSFTGYLDLPSRAGEIFEVAMGGPTSAVELLRDHGWIVCNPLEVAESTGSYQRYIQESKAEFSVAKEGYVVSRSGWFSERSAAYLASGRPVVTQDTGFSEVLETGSGLIAFSTPDEATAAVESVISNYEDHCRAARQLAEAHFDSRRILTDLIERATTRPVPSVT
jgi:hypothetical protein